MKKTISHGCTRIRTDGKQMDSVTVDLMPDSGSRYSIRRFRRFAQILNQWLV